MIGLQRRKNYGDDERDVGGAEGGRRTTRKCGRKIRRERRMMLLGLASSAVLKNILRDPGTWDGGVSGEADERRTGVRLSSHRHNIDARAHSHDGKNIPHCTHSQHHHSTGDILVGSMQPVVPSTIQSGRPRRQSHLVTTSGDGLSEWTAITASEPPQPPTPLALSSAEARATHFSRCRRVKYNCLASSSSARHKPGHPRL